MGHESWLDEMQENVHRTASKELAAVRGSLDQHMQTGIKNMARLKEILIETYDSFKQINELQQRVKLLEESLLAASFIWDSQKDDGHLHPHLQQLQQPQNGLRDDTPMSNPLGPSSASVMSSPPAHPGSLMHRR
jgi:hypothetical protein